jgi:thiopurine S-methyltransferase
MDFEFWHERWELNEIGFHREDDHPELVQHFSKLQATSGEVIFVPLCGKSRDLLFLAGQGLQVVGVELSPLAVAAFFSENGLTPQRQTLGELERWRAGPITIFCGDFYALSPASLAPAKLVYDRAALIALPEASRPPYAARLCELVAPGGRMLLITNSYDSNEMEGPPFSVKAEEVEKLYADSFEITLLNDYEAIDLHPGLQQRGLSSFKSSSFLLLRR